MELLSKVGNIIERVRTPLALAGLVVVVLYALYRQILGMDIFTRIGSGETFVLVDRVLLYLFILAVFAVALGAVGYILSIRNARSKRR